MVIALYHQPDKEHLDIEILLFIIGETIVYSIDNQENIIL